MITRSLICVDNEHNNVLFTNVWNTPIDGGKKM